MKTKNILSTAFTLAFSTLCMLGNTLPADAVEHRKKVCCPKCSNACELKVSEGTETKYCWKIECKTVCIPRVQFSWQWPWEPKHKACGSQSCDDAECGNCCRPPLKLAKSKKVKMLVKHEYECPVCEYKWAPKEDQAEGCSFSLSDVAECDDPIKAASIEKLQVDQNNR
ncbi:MAG: hypothetical protein NXI32_26230 [bacterium]|nr:hypothetical protein [bacterium]